MFAQTEIAIRKLFEQALVEPEQANLNQLWQNVEPVLRQMSKIDQLRLGGWAIAQLADLHHQRAMRWLSDWEETDVEAEPLIAEDWLNELIQQTMHLDLSELTRQPKPFQRKRSSQEVAEASTAGEGEKDGLLACVDSDDEFIQVQEVLAIAHDEDVSAWIEAISRELGEWVQSSTLKVTFSQLCQRLQRHDPQMTLVKVWLALLLGDYELEQQGDFYLSEIWISRSLSTF
ncbi:hypothetical protein ACN4EK_14150 [Pantanalinema rosaneae CENA516]|uniref:hypothetical protein n=1 Tax=Pantanalinema rosaneae TaxID=1620701 RepID=UPI003D6E8C95